MTAYIIPQCFHEQGKKYCGKVHSNVVILSSDRKAVVFTVVIADEIISKGNSQSYEFNIKMLVCCLAEMCCYAVPRD